MNKYTIILFGATGNLAKRKLIPSLYSLLRHNKDLDFLIIGAAKDKNNTSDILKKAKEHLIEYDEVSWKNFEKKFYYKQLDFENLQDYISLEKFVSKLEKSPKRIIYLSAPTDFFCGITQNLADSKIAIKNADHRIAYEKPFGWDLKSCKEINKCIKKNFSESQIFRIDHYLTKAIVTNISIIRFVNTIFEPTWNNKYIDHIEISLSETIGIENRGKFYDKYGALKDVFQNHILQILSLITIDKPKTDTQKDFAKEKLKIFKKLVIKDGILGQYDGYKNESDVSKNSKTETYVFLKAHINTKRWNGVNFYLTTGKKLSQQKALAKIVYKADKYHPNVLTIAISPDSGFILQLNAQKSDDKKIFPISMDFCYRCLLGPDSPHSYEVLLKEIIDNNHNISVSSDVIEQAWKIIEKIKKMKLPLVIYKPNTQGPRLKETEII
ncbi:glucose-6-phosphate dehydrogenase (NADP(+)) [Candidatus Dependentiae bacterium]|nr:glucose-6-phosphate dehydrogenase (NADP(+)) [Candidatus Dependentiae bacterium]